MMLSIKTYKIRKEDNNPIYKTYRFACFDTIPETEGMTFEQKFNYAMDCLREQIDHDRNNNDVTLFEPITIADVFLS